MARGKQTQEHKDLENELRNMILGNVRINDNGQSNRGGPSGRGRGNARGHSMSGHHSNRNYHGGSASQDFSQGQAQMNGTSQQGYGLRHDQNAQYGNRHSNWGHSSRGSYGGNHHANGSFGQGPMSPAGPLPGGNQPHMLQRPPHSPQRSQHGMPPSGPRGQMQPKVPPMATFIAQCELLDRLVAEEVPAVEMAFDEFQAKDAFRAKLEGICQVELKKAFSDLPAALNLRAYGSVVSGFATKGSDVDLTIIWSGTSREDPEFKAQLPRVFENAILKAGCGARLLSRTRVPIIKICEQPTEELYTALVEEREKWEQLPEEEKYPSLAPPPESPVEGSHEDAKADVPVDSALQSPTELDPDVSRSGKKMEDKKRVSMNDDPVKFLEQLKSTPRTEDDDLSRYCVQFINARRFSLSAERNLGDDVYLSYFLEGFPPTIASIIRETHAKEVSAKKKWGSEDLFVQHYEVAHNIIAQMDKIRPKKDKPWLREKALGKLDYPKTGVGIQCDINFSNPLGIHNSELLRLYSLCDPRVRPMILFVKAWTKRRKINSAYSGTLSSYGYVLMVLHFLLNVAQPPVLPNLQHMFSAPAQEVMFEGYNVSFYRDEQHIRQLAASRQLTQNNEPLGSLLRNFFHYYAAQGNHVVNQGFNWMRDIISIRSLGGPGTSGPGLVTKEAKGWTGAKTTTVEGREVRQRYLLAIEDPFEIDHNVGRPVTHNGIVTIRDEFRRAWRIIMAVGKGGKPEGELFDVVIEEVPKQVDEADLPPANGGAEMKEKAANAGETVAAGPSSAAQ